MANPTESSPKLSPTKARGEAPPPASPWPAQVPSMSAVSTLLNEPKEAPEPYRTMATRFVATLKFPERAALYTSSPSADEALLQKMVLTRFRLASAVETRPAVGEPDAVALDQLVAEVDEAIAAVNQLSAATPDAELKEICADGLGVLARGVQELLPVAADKRERIAYTPAAKPAIRMSSPELPVQADAPVGRMKILLGLLAGSLVLAAVGFFLLTRGPKPVPPLPPLPPNTELFGDPSSGAVAVRSRDGKPIEPQAAAQFREAAEKAGAAVNSSSPTMLTITAGP